MDGLREGHNLPRVSAARGRISVTWGLLSPRPPPCCPACPAAPCVTARFCCASRRGFAWAASTYGGPRGDGGLGLPFSWDQRALQHPEHLFSSPSWAGRQTLSGALQSGAGVWAASIRAPFHLPLLPPPCSGESLCFLPQTFGGPLLLALNPRWPLPVFSPEVLASYRPRKAPSATP